MSDLIQAVTTIVFLIELFVLYRLLVQQKEVAAEVQRERIALRTDRLQHHGPDALQERICKRVFNDRLQTKLDCIPVLRWEFQ
jgi:hypothetical protein